MNRGRIQNLRRKTTAAEREAFETGVFSTRAGSTTVGAFRWGQEVAILERADRRSRVRANGLDGWVANGDVVELRWLRRRGSAYTAPLYREATGSAKWFDLLWGDPIMVLTPGESRHQVRARNWTGYVDARDVGSTPLLELTSSTSGRATACSSAYRTGATSSSMAATRGRSSRPGSRPQISSTGSSSRITASRGSSWTP